MTLPNFLIIGVQKAGTTSIYNYLNEHPQIYMSPVKETNFLEQDWSKMDQSKLRKGIKTFAQYEELFNQVEEEIAIGEASPNYLFHYKTSAELIKRHVPEAKLISILRNPVDRAYSDYLMHIRDAIETPQSFGEMIASRSQSAFVFRKGFYYEALKHFFEEFDPAKIKIYLYDDLCQDAVGMMQDMYSFLGVDGNFAPNTGKKAQTAQVPKNQLVNQVLRKENPLRNFASATLKVFLPPETRQKIRSTLINLNSQSKKAAPLSPEERQKLKRLYREDILKLQDLINRDLTPWLE